MQKGKLDLNVDRSVFYTIQDALLNEGFVDASGELIVGVYDGDIIHLFTENVDEQYAGLVTASGSITLPAVSIEQDVSLTSPGAIGGVEWENRFYSVNVFGMNPSQSKEIAEVIMDTVASGIYVYDYDMGTPDASGFPLSGQFVERFDVRNRRNIRVPSTKLSILERGRREVTFEVVNLR